ncbi:hypothetical protein FKW77_001990 [Venturia effusa]|uniref:Rhodopsin domain-containing protein n=1 Tax=Venturia effusa TaxID=50376 RepID=A0A517KZ50_9PEZI|nr:hypothetical protein FKW77_001990 [Venturia effusa]
MRFNHPEAIPSWPTPNYVDPVTRGPLVYIATGIFFGLATLAIIVRLYARVFVRKWVGLDDYLIIFAWLSFASNMATVFWGTARLHWDRHIWDLPPSVFTPGAQALFAARLFWCTSSTCVRLSILVLYYRLVEHVQVRQHKWILHVTTIFVILIYLTYLGTIIFACVPVKAYFIWPSPDTCLKELYVVTILSAINTFSEALLAALPIPVLFQLRMKASQRCEVILLLCLGFLVATVGVVRTYFVYASFVSDDLTWFAGPHWICACVPSARCLIKNAGKALRNFPEEVSRSLSRRAEGSTNRRPDSESSHRFLDPKLSIYAAQAEIQLSRAFDVEGIGLDSFGYTVTITAGEPVKKRSPRRRKPAVPDIAEVEKGDESWQMHRVSSKPNGGIIVSQRKSLEVNEVFEDAVRSDDKGQGWDRFVL